MAKIPYIKRHTNAWLTRGMSLGEKLRFYSGIPTATGCIEWCGSRMGSRMGYGNMWWDGKTVLDRREWSDPPRHSGLSPLRQSHLYQSDTSVSWYASG